MTVEKGRLDEDYFGTPLNVAMSVPFTIEVGDIILGRISKVDEEFVYVSTGFKSEGRIPVAEFKRGPDADKEWKIDDEVEVMVDRVAGEDIYLSYEKVVGRRMWDTLAKKHEDGEPIEAEILQQVKGGYRTDVGLNRHAFLPGSHLGLQTQTPSELIGKKLTVYIIEFNTETENVVVSHRDWLKKQQEEAQGEAFENLEKGSIVEGRVTRLTNFGAFVDIGGGVEGLVHVSEIAWSRVGHPSQALSCGDTVNVKILDFDPETKRISLSVKQAAGDPWDKVDEHFAAGEIIVGTVVKMVKFGAFVMLRDGFEGLLHISELEQEKGGEPVKLNSGDEVKVKILNVDPKGRRIKLGLPIEKADKVSGEFKQYIDTGSSGISIGDMIDLDKNS